MTNVPPSEVAKVFGATFGRHLDDAPLGRWSGPFASEYGLHLVLVRERTAGAVPALADVREKCFTTCWQNGASMFSTQPTKNSEHDTTLLLNHCFQRKLIRAPAAAMKDDN